MPQATDNAFYDRADAHIELANRQLGDSDNPGAVAASMTFAATRFSTWVSARGFKSGEEMTDARDAMLKYFCDQYRMMLEDNLDDHIARFDQYMSGQHPVE